MDESEVQNLFYLIDVEKKGVITVQDARIAKELIRERFCIDEVGGVLIIHPRSYCHIINRFYYQQFQGEPSSGLDLESVKLLFSVFSMLIVCNVAWEPSELLYLT